MKLIALCVFLLLFCAVRALPQDIAQIFQARENWKFFEESTAMSKVIVCAEDQSVWALSDASEVYCKLSSEASFTKYGPANGLIVKDLAGYNANEMYFLAGGKLYESENMGPVSEITLPFASQVNNIAVVNASRNVYLEGYHGKRDWLAVAANAVVYSLFRDNDTFGSFSPISTAVTTGECRITNAGFKSLDFQYKYPPSNPCFGAVEHVYFNKVGSSQTETILPDQDPVYSGNVNCTYFEAPFNLAKDGNAGLDYWGTDKGLFVKTSGGCGLGEVRKKLDVKINDLEELNFFRDFFNDKIMLAAAADGLYYTSSSFFPEGGTLELDRIGFTKHYDFDVGVNSIAVEVNGFESERKFLCQSAVWLATAKGIVKIPMVPASKNIAKDFIGKYGPLVSVDAGLRPYYCVSNGEKYTFTVNLPDNNAGDYTIQWLWHRQNYFERTELPGTAGMNPKEFNSGGEYGARIMSPCGERIDIGGFWLRDPAPVTVDFNYNDVEPLYEGCTFTFTAKAGNQYKWEKDHVEQSEKTNVFVATAPGIYQLFYMDECSRDFVPLPPVKLEGIAVADPVITRSNNLSLCHGETVTLSVDDPGIPGVTYKWQRNGIPISGEVSREIEVDQPGNYDATLVPSEGCPGKRSATAVVVINEELKLTPPPEVQICTIRAQRLKLTAPAGFAKYTWDGVEGINPVLEVTGPGQYTLDVEDASGCKASTLYVVVPYCAPPVPPNVFSPNGDGINDFWTVGGLEDDPNAKIHIYNRFGVSVFDGSAKQPSWNGKLRGTDVPDGTYYYVVIKSSAKPITGSLVLIR
ncbi:MAG TPA: gliding motility-associated C-terminal domain-containing protein [Pedobacter sp.]|uniref:T9SS type B sorting domain-containing protein n=1 Tax=Pedobacter sp. TaxID=1411316 RepID=UPI002C1E6040|nr:gliding motility-associated C-terminal domain-containing protein [Pedobacter sp.]HMI01503.1 gliding motility-associated C-terminal domain-containing protein [Pedobacter sp.]